MDEPAFDHSSFAKNRDRLLAGEIAAKFLVAVLDRPRVNRLTHTLMFNGVCSFPPSASGPFRLVRRAARSTMEDLDVRGCASR